MPFISIKGTFHVVNYAPDGDTVRFAPENESAMSSLSGVFPKFNKRRHVSLRLEGIDTLETHYGGLKQPPPLADNAADALLAHLGITNIVWSGGRRSVVSADDGVPGYILARSTDKYGRVIAFAFPGAAPNVDGSEVFVQADDLRASANFMLAAEGLAYPTFYWGLFADLREALSAVAASARRMNKGIYDVDRTTAGFEAPNLAAITDDAVIMPKLFRRLSTFIMETGGSAGFKAALAASAEPVLDLRTQNFTHFDTFVEEDGSSIRLLRQPEEFVFDPMPQRIESDFQALLRAAANTQGIYPLDEIEEATTSALARNEELMSFRRRVKTLMS